MIPEQLQGSLRKPFDELVSDVLAYSRAKHGPMQSLHEGLAVIWEEFEEMKAEVFRQKVSPDDVLIELASVAAMCQRMAEDCQLNSATR
jgi:hypothetical protein